jgi:5-methylcytosine-specific restriction protein A
MDLYVRSGLHVGGSLPGRTNTDVVALSKLLQALPFHALRGSKFRNPDGVARKLSNFRSVQVPGTGSTNHSATDQRVWAEFKDDLPRLHRIAQAIESGGRTVRANEVEGLDPDEDGLPEGRLLLALHKRHERNRKLVNDKKTLALERTGRLACEVCDIDFAERYGKVGEGFIECHHLVPLASKAENRRTRLVDLALLCANCHRVIHRSRPWLNLSQLSTVVQKGSSSTPL